MSLVSIILTTLNSERHVARSIESCLNQTHRDLELLVVDGGSQDGTLETVGQFDDPRLRLIHQPDNAGRLPGAINLGMAAARGELLTWTQADSWYEPHAIETLVEHLAAHPEVALVYADYWDVNSSGAPLRYQAVHPPEDILVDDVVRVCFLFRREVYERIGPQKAQYYPVHDVPWRVQVAAKFRLEPLHEPLMHYMVHADSLTGRIGPWTLQRDMARALFQEGHFDQRGYRLRLAQIDVDQAYEAYVLRGDFGAFWRYALAGLWRDPRWLRNRGLWKYMAMSVLPNRARFREQQHLQWNAAHPNGAPPEAAHGLMGNRRGDGRKECSGPVS
jgi:glycosyltransferase involved in cell wall biosynthesis